MYDSLNDLLTKISNQIYKVNANKMFNFEDESFLRLEKMHISSDIKVEINSLKDIEKSTFLLGIWKHYVTSLKYLVQKTNISGENY